MGTVVNVTLGDDTRLNLILGQQLENAVTAVVFDFSAWKTEFGSGTVGLSVQRHKDKLPYAVVPTVSGTNATWNITETDTGKNGVGEVQVTYTVGSVVKKSVVYKFTVYRSLGEDGEYPVPGQRWMEDIEGRLEALEQGGSGSGLTEDIKTALLQLANKVVYIDANGDDYYQDLYDALYPPAPPATLTSITCVYTQSGTVYDTDTLNSLKSDLVVTAHYDDQTTATVTSYTLSGTLTEGTSTITVTYSGKTTTFNVTVTHATPSTDPVITDYDKYLNNSGTPTSGTGCCCTDYYDMLGTSLVIFTPWTEESYPRSSLNVVSYSGTTKTHYWNGMSTQSAPKSVSLSAAELDSDKLRFSLFTSGLSSCYAYDSDSGDIYFAGEESPYYGMSNISEAG